MAALFCLPDYGQGKSFNCDGTNMNHVSPVTPSIRLRSLAVIGLTLFSAALMLCMGPVQDTGDDAILSWQLSRGDGSFASFISPYLSMVFCLLYRLMPQVPWWPAFLFCGGIVLLAQLYAFALSRRRKGTRLLLCFFAFSGIWLSLIKTLNFTRTAIAFALAGLLFVLTGVSTGKKMDYWLGFFLFLLGFFVRRNAAALVLPFFVLLLLALIFQKNGCRIRGFFSYIRQIRYWGAAAGIAAILLFVICSTSFYQSRHSDYRDYAVLSRVRSQIVDYIQEYPSWEEGKDDYIAAGLMDETDWDLLTNSAFISDSHVFSLETLQNIAALRHSSTDSFARFVMALKRNYWSALDSSLTWLCVAAMILLVTFFGRTSLLPLLFSFGGAGLMLLWVAFQGRMMLRVWEPTVFSAMLCALFLCCYLGKDRSFRKWWTATATLLSLVVIFLCGLAGEMTDLKLPAATWDRDENMAARAAQIAADSRSVYLLSWGLIGNPPTPAPFGLWEAPGTAIPENYFALCNWDCTHPFHKENLQCMDIDNPVTALLERTDVKSDFDSRISHYLNAHYGSTITTTAVSSFADGLPIVQYTDAVDLTDATSSETYTAVLSSTEVVENYGAYWLRLTGCISGNFSVYYGNLTLDGQTVTCRIVPDEAGIFRSDILLTSAQSVWDNELVFSARDANGALYTVLS